MEILLPLNSPHYHIEPLFRIGHVFSWIVFCLESIRYHCASIDICIPVDLLFCNYIDNFLSGEFFVLCGFCYESLISRGADEGCKKLFFFIAFFHIFTLIFEHVREAVGLVFLHLIISDKVYQIDDNGYETDEDVVKTRIQSRARVKTSWRARVERLAFRFLFSTISKNLFFPNILSCKNSSSVSCSQYFLRFSFFSPIPRISIISHFIAMIR